MELVKQARKGGTAEISASRFSASLTRSGATLRARHMNSKMLIISEAAMPPSKTTNTPPTLPKLSSVTEEEPFFFNPKVYVSNFSV